MTGFRGFLAQLGVVVAALGCAPLAFAHTSTNLKQVQISNGSQIDLLFDGKVQKSQIRTEFINDIIQLSIQDVSVYPAKISSVNGGSLTKIFAYQYAPKLVRCRLTVKGKAEDYKDKFEIKAGSKILTVRMTGGATDGKQASATSATESASNEEVKGAHGGKGAQSAQAVQEAEERALLSRVIAADPNPAAKAAPVPAQAVEKPSRDAITLSAAAPSSESLPVHLTGNGSAKLGGGKPLPSPLKAFGKMGLVLALFGLFAFGLKRFAQGKAQSKLGGSNSALSDLAGKSGWLGTVSRMAKKGLGGKSKMIEVLSTHYLGPKKSIAVVRVAGRVLVLGVSNESINLITQLSPGAGDGAGVGEDLANAFDPLASMGLGGNFGLGDEDGPHAGSLGAPTMSKTASAAAAAAAGAGVVGANTALGKAVFADMLQAERTKPAFANPSFANPSGPAAYGVAGPNVGSNANVRAQIRNRLEGLKQL